VAKITPVGLGIIGGGAFGTIVARIAAALDELDLRMIYARTPDQTRARLGESLQDLPVVSDLDALLGDPSIDAVFVATPNYQHLPHARAALAAGKALLLEKPATASLAEALELAAIVRASKQPFMVSTPYRFDRASETVRQATIEGRLGAIYHARGHWLRGAGIPGWGSWFTQRRFAGGGALADLGYHVIDLLLHCAGWPPVLRVSGHVSGLLGETPVLTGDWRPPETSGVFDVEDFAAAQLTTRAGASLQIEISWASHAIAPGQPDAHGYAWAGSTGAATLFPAEIRAVGREPHTVAEDGFVRRIRAMLRELARRTRERDLARDDVDQALSVMEVIDAIYRSSATGREVVLEASG
jgi:predicted dehydrogenase